MNREFYLFVGNIAVWVGIGLYVAFLAGAQKRLARRVSRLEVLRGDK